MLVCCIIYDNVRVLFKQQNKIEIGQKNYIWKLAGGLQNPQDPPPAP